MNTAARLFISILALASAQAALASQERVHCYSVQRFLGNGEWNVVIEDDWRKAEGLKAQIDQNFPISDRFVTADEVTRTRDGNIVTYAAKTKSFVITVEAPPSAWIPDWLDRGRKSELSGRLEGELAGARVSEELRCSGYFDQSLN